MYKGTHVSGKAVGGRRRLTKLIAACASYIQLYIEG